MLLLFPLIGKKRLIELSLSNTFFRNSLIGNEVDFSNQLDDNYYFFIFNANIRISFIVFLIGRLIYDNTAILLNIGINKSCHGSIQT